MPPRILEVAPKKPELKTDNVDRKFFTSPFMPISVPRRVYSIAFEGILAFRREKGDPMTSKTGLSANGPCPLSFGRSILKAGLCD